MAWEETYAPEAETYTERQSTMATRTRKKKVRRAKPDLSLPEKPNEPSNVMTDYTFLIYGRKGIGKTSLGACWPNSLVFMFEAGRYNLKINQVPKKSVGKVKQPVLDWELFIHFLDLFVKDNNYTTAVIDTIDRCYLACFEHVCAEHGVEAPAKAGKESPAVWDAIAAEFERVMMPLHLAGDKNLVLISHEKEREIPEAFFDEQDDDEDNAFVQMQPSCKPAAFRFIQSFADFALHYTYFQRKRCLQIRNNKESWTSCGPEGEFFYSPSTNEPIRAFFVGAPATQAYKDLEAAFHNKKEDVMYKPPKVTKKRVKKGVKKKAKR